ncbi:MAG: hypothetical protein E7422_08970 [Ruminococcaceae bacterium]|nr:hypothetical protein [Oscillospiraceae bacterium]
MGDADKRMTEYEVYSYEAFRKKYRDDVRPVDGLTVAALDQNSSKTAEEEKRVPATVPDEKGLLEFCRTPRSRAEIIEFLAIPSAQYALRHYLDPLIEAGAIRLSLPEKPRSPKQRYETIV